MHHSDHKIRYVRAASGSVWKSFKVTLAGKLRETQSRFVWLSTPFNEGHELINAAEEIVDDCTKKCEVLEKVKCEGFTRKVRKVNPDCSK